MSLINAITSLIFPKGSITPSYSPPELRATGHLEDPPDSNDPIFELMRIRITPLESNNVDVIDLRKWCSAVENQSSLGSCVANAAVGGLEMRRIHNGLQHVDLSRLFVYYNARLATRATSIDDGSYIKLALESMTRLGVCKETIWPYDTTKVFLRPSWNSYRDAYTYKINQFYRITATGEERHNQIIQSLKAHYPVIFGVQVYTSFKKCTGVVQMPTLLEAKLGGHAMLIVGVDIPNRTYIVRNSWGSGWGDGGYCYMPFDYLNVGEAGSLWSFTL